jgi:Rrf2 family nitric oxide-sensitive transcriptional repressor
MKVVHQLGAAGYVETIRGKNGGLRLAVRRLNPSGICRIRPVCVLKGVMDDALGAFLAVLDRYTLADLVAPRKELAGLLGVSSNRAEMTKSSTRKRLPASRRSRAPA